MTTQIGNPMKMNNTKRVAALIGGAALLTAVFGLIGCSSDATVASQNLSKAADMFEIERRIVFYDAIQGAYLLSIEGKCSIKKDNQDAQLEVTCKTAPDQFKKHFLGISDNVTYFAEQVQAANASVYHYRVIFRPEAIVPNVDLETSAGK